MVSWLSLPLWRRICTRAGIVDDPGHRKIHAQSTPLAGGLAVLTGMMTPLLAGVVLCLLQPEPGTPVGGTNQKPTISSNAPARPQLLEEVRGPLDRVTTSLMAHGFNRRSGQLAALFAGAVGMMLIGLYDDRKELRPMAKFGLQFLVALLVALAGIRITIFVPNVLFSHAITILWILTVTNALNFMDNMNGLCGGLGAIGCWCFALAAAGMGQYLVALLAFAAAGALVGFLPHNFPKASAFLGDSGSHLTGYLLAVLAILPHFHSRQNPRPWAVLIPLLILAVPLADLAWVVVLRWRLGRPFYVGDTNHLSHRLVRRGLSRTRAVLVIWLLAAAAGALALI